MALARRFTALEGLDAACDVRLKIRLIEVLVSSGLEFEAVRVASHKRGWTELFAYRSVMPLRETLELARLFRDRRSAALFVEEWLEFQGHGAVHLIDGPLYGQLVQIVGHDIDKFADQFEFVGDWDRCVNERGRRLELAIAERSSASGGGWLAAARIQDFLVDYLHAEWSRAAALGFNVGGYEWRLRSVPGGASLLTAIFNRDEFPIEDAMPRNDSYVRAYLAARLCESLERRGIPPQFVPDGVFTAMLDAARGSGFDGDAWWLMASYCYEGDYRFSGSFAGYLVDELGACSSVLSGKPDLSIELCLSESDFEAMCLGYLECNGIEDARVVLEHWGAVLTPYYHDDYFSILGQVAESRGLSNDAVDAYLRVSGERSAVLLRGACVAAELERFGAAEELLRRASIRAPRIWRAAIEEVQALRLEALGDRPAAELSRARSAELYRDAGFSFLSRYMLTANGFAKR
jgi:hypothetical protein